MRNFVWAFAVLGLSLYIFSATSCKKEPDCEPTDCVCNNNCPTDSTRFQLSALVDSAAGRASDFEIITEIHYHDESSMDSNQVRWVVLEDNLPAGWERAICDNDQCWAPSMSARTMTVMQNDTFPFSLHFYPNGTAGTGTSTVRIYAVDDSAATVKEVLFRATATN